MRVLTKLSTALLLFAALFVFTPAARADEAVIVTGGFLSSGNFSGGPFTLISQNFTLRGGVNYGPLSIMNAAGRTVTLTSAGSGLDLRGGFSGAVDGVTYGNLFYEGFLSFSATVTIPFDDSPVVTLTAPFALTGHLRVCTQSTSGCPPGFIFESQLLGQGVATIQFLSYLDSNGVRRYDLNSIRYDIQAPAQTPEPATILLLGTALTALGASARRRRARREE